MGQDRATLPVDAVLMVRMSPDNRRRLKAAAAVEGLSYAEFIVAMLDERESRFASSMHPLHR